METAYKTVNQYVKGRLVCGSATKVVPQRTDVPLCIYPNAER